MPMGKVARRCWRAIQHVLETSLLAFITWPLVLQPMPAADIDRSKPAPPSLADQKKWQEALSPDQKVFHVLNRITFGPRPADIERVRQMGVEAFLEEQLNPGKIDDSAIEGRVNQLPTLSMSAAELVENYPRPKMQPAGQGMMAMEGPPSGAQRAQEGPQRIIMELAQEELLRGVYSHRQLDEVMVQFWMNHFNIFAPKGADRWLLTSFERDTIRPRAMGKFEDLLVATAKSPAMLFYLDNWMSSTPNPTFQNEFARRMGKPAPMTGRYDRPALGPFRRPGWRRGLFGRGGLGRSPIDRRVGRMPVTRGAAPLPNRQNRRGLNENYAREVMELHTMGVEGGYTQKDVIEVARCLTGWTIDRPQQGGEFAFRPQMHDFGTKVVLDHKIAAGRGMEDGIQVLHLLAHHPSTAHFISLKLCRRFVADDPPKPLVDSAAKTFLKTDGDIRAVLRTILTSPEFNSQAAYRSKVKSPLELVASSIRSLGAETDAGLALVQAIARMGQPMFQYQAPTGFPDRAATWINSGALLIRLNFATMLATNRIPGTEIHFNQVDPAGAPVTRDQALEMLAPCLVGGTLSPETREAILKKTPSATDAPRPSGGPSDLETVAGLLIASPEFQRR